MTAQDAKVWRSVWKLTSSSFAERTAFSYAFRTLSYSNTRPDSCGPRFTNSAYDSSFRGTSRRLPLLVISRRMTPRPDRVFRESALLQVGTVLGCEGARVRGREQKFKVGVHR